MNRSKLMAASLTLLAASLLLVSKPVLLVIRDQFSDSTTPGIYLYLFGLWIFIVAVVALIFNYKKKTESNR